MKYNTLSTNLFTGVDFPNLVYTLGSCGQHGPKVAAVFVGVPKVILILNFFFIRMNNVGPHIPKI